MSCLTLRRGRVSRRLSKEEKKEMMRLAKATGEMLLDVVTEFSDALPPLRAASAGLRFIVDHAKKTGENRDEMKNLEERIRGVGKIAQEARLEDDVGRKRYEELNRLEDISGLLEPLMQQSFVRGFFMASYDNAVIKEYIIKVSQALTDYQVSLMQDLYALNLKQISHDERIALDKLTRAKDAAFNASDDRMGCLEGTRVEIQLMLQKWARDSGAQRIYWLNGIAGSGKSTIAQSFAESLYLDGKLGASFFCSRHWTDRSNTRLIFPTIAFQLAQVSHANSPGFRKALLLALEKNPDIASLSLQNQIKELIIGPFQESPMETVILIDALDECRDDNPISKVLRVLAMSIEHLTTIKFFITSRPESHIRSAFALPGLKSITDTIVLHEIETSLVTRDIRLFLKRRLTEVCQTVPAEADLDRLTEQAGGLFIFASTMVKFLEGSGGNLKYWMARILNQSDSLNPRRPEDTIGYSGGRSPFKDLDLLYLNVLRAASERADLRCIQKILGLLVVARDLLSTDTVSQLLGLDESLVIHSLDPLHSILLVPKDPTGHVRFHHKSLPDFLTTRCADSNYLVDMDDENHSLALRCLKLMTRDLKRNICGIAQYSMNDVEPIVRDKNISEALRYCCRQWANHILSDDKRNERLLVLQLEVEQFLAVRQLMWLEVLSLIQELRQAVEALNGIREWLISLDAQQTSQLLLDRVTDGYRFVLAFFDLIEVSATHIYHSALVFAPARSLLKQSHSEDLENEAKAIIGVSSTWDGPLRTMSMFGRVWGLAYSQDGRMIAATSETQCHIFLSATGERLADLDVSDARWSRAKLSFSCDNRSIAVAAEKHIALFGVESGTRLFTLSTSDLSDGDIMAISFHPHHAHILLVIDDTGHVIVWDATTGGHLSVFEVAHCFVACWLACKGEWTVVIGTRTGDIMTWATTPPRQIRSFTRPGLVPDRVCAIVSSPDGFFIASGTSKGAVTVYNSQSTDIIFHHAGWLDGRMESVKFSSTSPITVLATMTSSTGVETYRLGRNTRQMVASYGPHLSIYSIAFSPNTKYLVSGANNGEINIWEIVLSNMELGTVQDLPQRVTAAHFSYDGTLVVSGSTDGSVRIWNSNDGKLLRTLTSHSYPIHDAILLHDSAGIVSIDSAGVAMLWDFDLPREGPLFPRCEAPLSPPQERHFLAPFSIHNGAFGFFYIHADLGIECWAVDETDKSGTRLVLAAQGSFDKELAWGFISQVSCLDCKEENSSVQIIIQYEDGKQFSSIWKNATPLHSRMGNLNIPLAETLEFVCEERSVPSHTSSEFHTGFVKSRNPSHMIDSSWIDLPSTWIADEQGQRRLWLPVSVRSHLRQWCSRKLLLQGVASDQWKGGQLFLIDFGACEAWQDGQLVLKSVDPGEDSGGDSNPELNSNPNWDSSLSSDPNSDSGSDYE